MNALLNSIPRFDAASGLARSGFVSVSEVRRDHRGYAYVPGLGVDISKSTPVALSRLMPEFRRAWPDADEKQVRDAATDFVTSGLERMLGPDQDIVRPPDPYLFVPGPGLTPVIPSRNELPPGWRTNAYHIRTHNGQANWHDPDSLRDVERASYQREKEVRGAEYYALAWGYTIPQTWEADILGEDLLGWNQHSAVLGLDDFRERVSMWGSADKNIAGFATLADAVLLLGGQNFSAQTLTAQQMLQRIAAYEQRYMLANQQRRPTAVVMPHADRHAMQSTFFNGTSDTAWDVALRQYPWLNNATFSESLILGSEDGTGARWILYTQDPPNLYVEHTDTMIFGPFQDRMSIEFVMLRRHGGVVSKIPERVMYVDFTP